MSKNKTGRPKIDIDYTQVDKMLAIQCTGEEIAAVLGLSYDTLERRTKEIYDQSFADYSHEKRGVGRMSLRRRQFAMAETVPTMAIWLGKQYLGQTDKQEQTTDNTHRIAITRTTKK